MDAYDKTSIQINHCKRILALVDDYVEKQDPATRTDLRKALMEEFEAPAIAPPVAAVSVDSIDTNEFCDLMTELQDVHERLGNSKPNWDALIAHIHAWGAQQHEAGYHEGVEQLRHERDNIMKLASSRREWAEKAEADLKQVNEWRAAALASNQQMQELMAAKLSTAEARVKELEAKFLSVDHHPV